MNFDDIRNDPNLQNIPKEKLDLLLSFANQPLPKNPQELSVRFLESMQQAKEENMHFNSAETELLIEILKSQLSPADQQKADRMIRLLHHMQSRQK
ncbi:MAG: hypothetical protein ACI4HI_08965 [Lachnospiraceae bacterium]